MLVLRNCKLHHAPGDAPAVDVLLDEGRIAAVGELPELPEATVLDAGGRTLIPGLIDLHIHGAGGADVLDGTPEALEEISRTLARLGVTGFLGTTVMQPHQGDRHLPVAAERVDAPLGGARLLGLHLEGPFINPERRGGIPQDTIYAYTPAALQEVLDLTQGTLRMMTLAPELPGSLSIIERLRREGAVPSFGHSAASYEETRAGIEAGICHVTHLFNAMPGLHHRDPGPLVALHEAEAVSVQLISDDVHLNRHVVRWTRSVFGPERCICITDGMRTVGLPDGRYRFGQREFEARDGAARYLDGTLIGTSLGLLEVVLRYREYTGCSLAEAVDSASALPARLLGLNKGRIAPGYDADLVLLEEDGRAWATLVAGKLVYGGG